MRIKGQNKGYFLANVKFWEVLLYINKIHVIGIFLFFTLDVRFNVNSVNIVQKVFLKNINHVVHLP